MKPGDIVVCVDDTGTAPNYNEIDPNYPAQEIVEGQQYKLRYVGPAWLVYEGNYTGVKLEGVVRPHDDLSAVDDPAFRADRFRPVVEPKVQREMEEVV